MQGQNQDRPNPLPAGVTDAYLRHAVLRVRRWVRNRHKPGRMRSVPRHIHEKTQVVRRFIEAQQGTPV